jgi:hypothetical protein
LHASYYFVCFLVAGCDNGVTSLGLTADAISFQVNHDTRTVLSTAQGILRGDDFRTYAHQLASAGVFAYPQLIDARKAHLKISPSDVEILFSLMKDLRKTHGPAKTAFVTKNPADFGMMRMYELRIGEHDRGFAVFYDINQGMEWILS